MMGLILHFGVFVLAFVPDEVCFPAGKRRETGAVFATAYLASVLAFFQNRRLFGRKLRCPILTGTHGVCWGFSQENPGIPAKIRGQNGLLWPGFILPVHSPAKFEIR
ncbi:MAG TPA: hypothetical protein H9671_01200 [Firmicutes bacterium]|nr:hypothetical protein [Bacillota bacterium]